MSGGTVYTAGYCYNGTAYIPCYWTGTVRTELSTSDSYTYALAVSGETVYAAGYLRNKSSWYGLACYWAGTERTDLDIDDSDDACAYAIAVVG